MSLLDLPSELLDPITSELSGKEILRLWLCGSRVLNAKLGPGGGVRSLDLTAPHEAYFPWPSVLFSFKELRSFSLSLEARCTIKHADATILCQMSKKIQKLQIAALNAEATFRVPEEASNLPIVQLDTYSSDRILDLQRVFPSLVHLHIHGSSIIDYSCLLAGLPQNLKTFDFRFSTSFQNIHIASLPRSVTSITLEVARQLRLEGILALPPNLEVLNISDVDLTVLALEALPRTLKTLDLSFLSVFPSESISKLPPGLKSLKLVRDYSITAGAIKQLPRTLTELHQSENYRMSDLAAANLPPGLTFLDWNGTKDLSPEAIEILPRSLKTLLLDRYTNVINPVIHNLPPGLTKLSLANNKDIDDESAEKLPRSLTWLHLPSNTILSTAGIRNLPHMLTYLDLLSNNAFDDSTVAALPRGLKCLKLGSTLITTDSTALLPRGLESLYLPKIDTWVDCGIEHLPRTLTVLDLTKCTALTDACMSLMPRKLVILRLRYNKNLTAQCLPHIPSGIRIFDAQSPTLMMAFFLQRPQT
jgi:Leucine-rich repeat (LRR) protein